jgi:hypothetical protein
MVTAALLAFLLGSVQVPRAPAPLLHGLVVDSANQRPLARAHVIVNDKECAVTGPSGEFVIPGPHAGAILEVHIHRPGYYRRELSVAANPSDNTQIRATVALRRVPGPGEQMARKISSAWNSLISAAQRKSVAPQSK